MEDLGTLPGVSDSRARAVNADGSIVVGVSGWAFRWTAAGGMENLGTANPKSVSADGSVIAGDFQALAARWTSTDGWLPFTGLSGYDYWTAVGISSDGTRIVGDSGIWIGDPVFPNFDYLYSEATRWTQNGAAHDVLPGNGMSTAKAISGDGTVVVGAQGPTGGPPGPPLPPPPPMIAFRRFIGGGGTDILGSLPGHSSSMALAVSGDGAVVVGRSGFSLAFRWTSNEGMVDLNAYLPSLGIDLAGWELTEAVGISADGRVIVGNGVHNGVNEGWVAIIASVIPGDLNCDGQYDGRDVQGFVLALLDPVAYGAAFPTCSTALADTNSDGVVDIDDLVGFVEGLLGA
jgi:uncharacterized membrane protein